MSARGGLLLAAALAPFLCACGADRRTPVERGRAAYASYNCRQCHAIGDEGGRVGPDLTFVGVRKGTVFLDLWLRDPQAWEPGAKMPAFGFTERTRQDLVAYLSTLRGQAYARSKPWNDRAANRNPVRRGELLFERAGCASCHGRGGAGGMKDNNVPGATMPALRESASTFTRAELIRKIKAGVAHPQKADPAGPDPLLAMPAWGEALTDDEIGSLADYLLSLRPTTAVW